MEWIVQIPILFFSVVVHELSHGWTALAKGDDTAELEGRLTLNPIPHIDPFGTVFLPLFCWILKMPLFAWAKPVPVNAGRLRSPRSDMVQVALAGPCANLLLALAAAALYKLTSATGAFPPDFQDTVLKALFFAVSINLFLAFFNLIPVHPLDGSQVVSGVLPFPWRAAYERHAPYGFYIILALAFSGLLSPLVLRPSQAALAFLARLGLVS